MEASATEDVVVTGPAVETADAPELVIPCSGIDSCAGSDHVDDMIRAVSQLDPPVRALARRTGFGSE